MTFDDSSVADDGSGASRVGRSRRARVDRQPGQRTRTVQDDSFPSDADFVDDSGDGRAVIAGTSRTSPQRARTRRALRGARDASRDLFDDNSDADDSVNTRPRRQITAPDIEPELDDSRPSPNSTSASNQISGFTGDGGSPNSRSGSNDISGFNPRGTRQTDTGFEDRNSLPEDNPGSDDSSTDADPNSGLFDDSDDTGSQDDNSRFDDAEDDDFQNGSSQRSSRRSRSSSAGNRRANFEDDARMDAGNFANDTADSGSRRERSSSRRGTNNNLTDLQRRFGMQFSANGSGGLTLDNVAAGSIAAQAGLQAGDDIMSINNQPVESPEDLARLFRRIGRSGRVLLDINRDGEEVTVTLDLRQVRALADRFSQRFDEGSEESSFDGRRRSTRRSTRSEDDLDRSLLTD